MFLGFTLLSLYVFNSHMSRLKWVCLSFLEHVTQWSWQGASELRFSSKRYGGSTALHAKHAAYASFCSYLARYKVEQRGERIGYLANEKQLGQVPDSSQACELNKAHAIDRPVIYYLFWM